MKLQLFSLLLCLRLYFPLGATALPSSISSNTVLNAANSPYTMTGSVTIAKGARVLVMPGVRIQSVGTYTLYVNGELQCLGNRDSLIHIENTVVVFNAGSVGYKKSTGGGSKFLYTRFAPGQTGSAIRSSKASVFAHHCVFEDVSYAISAYTDSVDIYMRNSKILGRTNGYSIFNSNKSWHLELFEDTIVNGGYLYMGSSNVVYKCLFLGGTNTYYGLYGQIHTKEADISCNYFKNIYYGINLSSLAIGHGRFNIHDNFVDSAYYGLYMATQGIEKDSFSISGNAFLWCNYAAYFLNSVATPAPVNWALPRNYWGSSDTAQIKKFIYDNRRFSMIPYRVDYTAYLNQPPAPCGPVAPGFKAGINPHKAFFDLALYPNPVEGVFSISVPGTERYTWTLRDLNGRAVAEGTCIRQQQVSTSGLKPGSYLLQVRNNKGVQVCRQVLLH
jgi:hypothetical protein